jgi:hypothetical protein
MRALSLSLRDLLRRELQADINMRDFFDPAHSGTMVVSLLAPEEMSKAGQDGLSIWLYRIERDEQTLNLPPRRAARDRLLSAPLPLKLHYLAVPVIDVTTRPDGPELAHNILGVVLQVLNDHPTLRGSDLLADLAGTSQEIHVRLESLDLDQMSRMWDALELAYRLCVSYEVAVVSIDSGIQPVTVPAVDAVLPTYGVVTSTEAAP